MLTRLTRALAAQRDRWPLWLPVAFAGGIAIYFAFPLEPPLWLTVAGAGVAAAFAWTGRQVAAVRWPLILMTACALGMAGAKLRTTGVATLTLERALWADVTGTVLRVEDRPKAARVTLGRVRFASADPSRPLPNKVRVTISGGDGRLPEIGARVRVRARLTPPPAPVSPGGFDFRRWAFFEGLGGVGFAVSAIERVSGPDPPTPQIAIDRVRRAIARAVTDALPGRAGPVAVALLVGDRSGLDPQTVEAFRQSGLAHLLAISGLHMGMVAGMLFFLSRLALAAIPFVALRYPIKKWAAVIALIGSGVYLLLAGAPVPTQRAFVMTALALVAILIDREPVSLRLVAWAALAVLILAPEVLVGASFQLSFAAVVALVAVYEAWRDGIAHKRGPLGAVRRLGHYGAGVVSTSAIAGLATAPFIAFHFQTVAYGGIAANLLAVPITGLVTMPAGLLAMVLMPFDLEYAALAVMAFGIEATLMVAEYTVSALGPGLAIPAGPAAALVWIAVGGCWLAIWRGPLRMLGILPVLVSLVLWVWVRPPDLLISRNGEVVSVAVAPDLWVASTLRSGRFARRDWRRRWSLPDMMALAAAERQVPGRVACDDLGCVVRVKGRLIAIAFTPQAAAADCGRVDILITRTRLRRACNQPALIVDRTRLREAGAHAIWLKLDAIVVESAGDRVGHRPWVDGFAQE